MATALACFYSGIKIIHIGGGSITIGLIYALKKILLLDIMKVLLLGDTGSVGREFKQLFLTKKVGFYCINRKKKKFKFNFSNLKNSIDKQKPHIIINCIGLTGLIYCQNKKKEAYEVNSKIPEKIIKIIKKTHIRLIHFSTEAVFKGN